MALASVSSGPEAVSEPTGLKEKCIKDTDDKSCSIHLQACHKGVEAGGDTL